MGKQERKRERLKPKLIKMNFLERKRKKKEIFLKKPFSKKENNLKKQERKQERKREKLKPKLIKMNLQERKRKNQEGSIICKHCTESTKTMLEILKVKPMLRIRRKR